MVMMVMIMTISELPQKCRISRNFGVSSSQKMCDLAGLQPAKTDDWLHDLGNKDMWIFDQQNRQFEEIEQTNMWI